MKRASKVAVAEVLGWAVASAFHYSHLPRADFSLEAMAARSKQRCYVRLRVHPVVTNLFQPVVEG